MPRSSRARVALWDEFNSKFVLCQHMLILDADRVEYCQLTCKTDRGVEVRPGVTYRQKLFVKGKTFPLAQKQVAIEQSRQEFAERRGLVYILLVVGEDSLTLWYQDDSATLLPNPAERSGPRSD